MFDKNRNQAEQLDKDMAQSVELCLLALKKKDKNQCTQLLSQALSLGEKCFQKWGLISYDLEKHMEFLKRTRISSCEAYRLRPWRSCDQFVG